jgi:hypothetical protein
MFLPTAEYLLSKKVTDLPLARHGFELPGGEREDRGATGVVAYPERHISRVYLGRAEAAGLDFYAPSEITSAKYTFRRITLHTDLSYSLHDTMGSWASRY